MFSKKVLIGVGSPHGDDQIGWLIADEVRLRIGDSCLVHKVGSPLEILDRIDDVDWLGICDACRGAGQVGDWNCWTWPDEHIIQSQFTGSHDFGLAATLQLATRLKRLPDTVKIWGIEIGSSQAGDSISLPARNTIPRVADAIRQEILRCY